MPRLTDVQWKEIREEWDAGQLDIREIGRIFGISHVAISKRAKSKGWPARPDRSDIVTNLVTNLESTGNLETNPRAALMAFERAIGLLREHRSDIRALRVQLEDAMARLETVKAKRGEQGRDFTLHEIKVLVAIIADASLVLSRIVPLERKAFGFTDQDGPSEFDGLTADELDAVEQTVRKALGR